MKMLVIDSRHNPGSWIIKIFTFSMWNHCAVLFDNDHEDIDECHVIDSTFITGVRLMKFKEYKRVYKRIVQIDSGAPNEIEGKKFALQQLGKKYDWTALIGIVIQNRRWDKPDRWFCSELAEAIRIAAGRRIFRTDVNSILPRDVYAAI